MSPIFTPVSEVFTLPYAQVTVRPSVLVIEVALAQPSTGRMLGTPSARGATVLVKQPV